MNNYCVTEIVTRDSSAEGTIHIVTRDSSAEGTIHIVTRDSSAEGTIHIARTHRMTLNFAVLKFYFISIAVTL